MKLEGQELVQLGERFPIQRQRRNSIPLPLTNHFQLSRRARHSKSVAILRDKQGRCLAMLACGRRRVLSPLRDQLRLQLSYLGLL